MKFFIVVLTYYDQKDNLRSTPMSVETKSKHAALTACRQQAWERYRLLEEDIVDVHAIPNKRSKKELTA